MYKLLRVVTAYAMKRDESGIEGIEYGTAYHGYRSGVPDGFVILQDFDGRLKCLGIQTAHAMAIVDHVAAAGLAEGMATAYGIYNGDEAGPDSGCFVDTMNIDILPCTGIGDAV